MGEGWGGKLSRGNHSLHLSQSGVSTRKLISGEPLRASSLLGLESPAVSTEAPGAQARPAEEPEPPFPATPVCPAVPW